MGSPVGSWDALHLRPLLSTRSTAIDARAGTRKQTARIRSIHRKRENIRIIDHSAVNRCPGDTSIQCSPGQMRSACINNASIVGIKRQRDNSFKVRVILWRNPLPVVSTILRPENTTQGPGNDGLRMLGMDRKGQY